MKQTLIILVSVNAIAVILTVGLWETDHEVAGAVIGAGTLFGWLLLIVLGAFAAGSWWTRETMNMAGDLVLRGQESDDRRDIAMISALSRLTGWWKESRQLGSHEPVPLPMATAHWLPEFHESDLGE